MEHRSDLASPARAAGTTDVASRWFATAVARGTDAHAAGRHAAADACAGRDAALLVVFSSAAHDGAALLAGVAEAAGAAAVIGCTTAGEIVGEGPADGAVAVAALGGPGFEVRTAAATSAGDDLRAAAAHVAGSVHRPAIDGGHDVLVLLADGLHGDQQEVVRGAYGAVGAAMPLVGGCAGDDLRMQGTAEYHGTAALQRAVVGAAIRSTAPIGVGVRHGWRRVGEPMLVTRAAENRVYTLDDRPALDVYLDALDAPPWARVPEGFTNFAITHPLGLSRRRGEEVRFVAGADFDDRSLGCIADVPSGGLAWLMEGDEDSVLAAVHQAADDALAQLDGRPPIGALVFDCITRRGVLDAGITTEVATLRDRLGDVPICGFYTYGEIARTSGVNGFHNQTLVVVVFGVSAMGFIGWSTQQLSEFAALLAPLDGEDQLRRVAVERAGEAFDAEICYLVSGETVLASVGAGADRSLVRAIEARRVVGRTSVDIPGIGPCRLAQAELDDDGHAEQCALVLCRAGEDPFGAEELALLRGMARVIVLTTRNVRLVASLRDRHRLLERLSGIQRAISTRVALSQVLEQILEATHDLLGARRVVIWEVDRADPAHVRVAAAFGVDAPAPGTSGPRGGSVAGRCLDAAGSEPIPFLDETGGVLAAPVHEIGGAVAALVVSRAAGQPCTSVDADTLLTLAEHASVAMNDARTVDAMFEAYHDHVTGLPNHALFFDRGEEAAAAARLEGRHAAVLFIDLDGFKQVNDTLGHEAGDRLLYEVGARLRGALRAGDLVARLGGDEFAVLLVRDRGHCDAAEIAARLLEEVRRPVEIDGAALQVRASIGVAVARGAERMADLVRDADTAMYRAKLAGKDRSVVFEPAMHAAVSEHRELERDLRRALDGGELRLAFQPIVRLADDRLVGVEALSRWTHETRGPIGPREFVAMAEEMNVVDVIDRFALHHACLELQTRRATGRAAEDLDVFVNVSRGRLRNDSIIEDVRGALEATDLPAHRLVVEFEEDALAGDLDGATRRLWRLHELGVQLAIDSFGNGSSSLSALPRLPFGILKMDATCVSATVRGARRGAVAVAIVEVARAFGLRTVGEGVEHLDHLGELRRLGCTYGQGFLFSRPIADGEWTIATVDGTRPTTAAGRR